MPKLPDNSMISVEELLRFREAHKRASQNRKKFNKWLAEQPSYFDQFNAERPFNDLGEFKLTELTDTPDELLWGKPRANSNGYEVRPITSREEFELKLKSLEVAADPDYLDKKLTQYRVNYAESLITTYGEAGERMAQAIRGMKNEEFVRLALKYDLSIKYTDSDKYQNPFTHDRETERQFERLQDAILNEELYG